MVFGILYYSFCYVVRNDTVNIICTDIDPLYEQEFCKDELIKLNQIWGSIIPVYQEALNHFPQGDIK